MTKSIKHLSLVVEVSISYIFFLSKIINSLAATSIHKTNSKFYLHPLHALTVRFTKQLNAYTQRGEKEKKTNKQTNKVMIAREL